MNRIMPLFIFVVRMSGTASPCGVCAQTGIGRDRIYQAIREGQLIARKLGRRTAPLDSDLHGFVALPKRGAGVS